MDARSENLAWAIWDCDAWRPTGGLDGIGARRRAEPNLRKRGSLSPWLENSLTRSSAALVPPRPPPRPRQPARSQVAGEAELNAIIVYLVSVADVERF
jgi:hypothetical protein